MSCVTVDTNPEVTAVANGIQRTVGLMEFVSDFGGGGTERQFVNLGLALEPSRFAVWFGCLDRWGRHLEEIDARGIPILDYGVRTFKDPHVVRAQLQLARDIRQLRIEIVHSYNFYANVFAIPAAKLAGARVVASIRDMGVYLSPLKRRLQRTICRLADQILVNASAIKDWLVADGYDGGRITMIPNGIDLTRFDQPRMTGSIQRQFGLPVNAPLVGVVGRVTGFKGIEDFLRAAALVALRFSEAQFLIVGEGIGRRPTVQQDANYRQELESLATQLGLQDRVVFTGFRSDVEQIFADLSISVQPSLSEGLSNVLLESMAAGLPVVATRVGGASQAVQDGLNGLLVHSGDPDSLAGAICRLLADPTFANRLGKAARRSVAERFSITRLAASTSQFYESLLQRTSS